LAIDFLDLWWVPIVALALQVYASYFLYRIYRKIGYDWQMVFLSFQAIGYAYIGFILYRYITTPLSAVEEPLEFYRLFFGLAYPVVNNLLHLRMKRIFYRGLQPNKRDVERDRLRDSQRDPIRDARRDSERDNTS
jgi:hypothetical protein